MKLLAALFLLASVAAAQAPAPFERHGLTLKLPELAGVRTQKDPTAQLALSARGAFHELDVEIQLWFLSAREFGVSEPDELVRIVEDNQNGAAKGDRAPIRFAAPRMLAPGPGLTGYAALAEAERAKLVATSRAVDGRICVLTGLVPDFGFVVEVDCLAVPTEAQRAALVAWLETCATYAGPKRDPKWTKAELEERWKRDAPPGVVKELETPIRTAHYLILGNSSGGKAFAKKMEECYAAIQKVYPFPEVPGRRLMPVFLFQTGDQYFEFYAKIAGISLDAAKKSKGHAWRDYYATWYEAPNDPVHVHEATHQIFANRLFLTGGGSWFQEGVAEYMSTKPADRAEVARLVKKQRHTKLAQFVKIESLLMSAGEDVKGGDEAGDHYKLASLLVEFLRESKWKPEKFQDYLHAVGRVERSNPEAIERALQSVYGCGLAELEAAWVAWAQKR
ncbi:MAG: hypothetical protein EPO68_16450 [Planctomycetota bacterium]|nr:MAG: hypothetical protein EPO68_16450 [Planctomycetota bacterium]